ncbi:MAG: hypothetical protein U0452_00005 [Anaerolineae bacterium]
MPGRALAGWPAARFHHRAQRRSLLRRRPLAPHRLTSAQRAGLLPAFIDIPLGFDAVAAQRADVQFDRLLLVRPPSVQDALSLAYDLLCEGSCELIVIDADDVTLPDQAQRLLRNAIVRSPSALVFLTSPETPVPGADLRLSVVRTGWDMAGGDCYAIRTRVTVESGRGLPVGRSVDLRFVIDEMAPYWPAS